MKRLMTSLIVMPIAAIGFTVSTADTAHAYSRYCTNGTVGVVGKSGTNFTHLRTYRKCLNIPKGYNVAGMARISRNQIDIQSANTTTKTDVDKATLHEMVHIVEYRTTATDRKKLYSYLSVPTTGNYYALSTSSGSNLAVWKKNPRERLAEAVVQCQFGSPNHTGMMLVPKAKCSKFMSTFKLATAHAK